MTAQTPTPANLEAIAQKVDELAQILGALEHVQAQTRNAIIIQNKYLEAIDEDLDRLERDDRWWKEGEPPE
ncbi:MAG: hypothetical protein WED34_04830 [Planctomycetales bacterium]